MKIQPTVKRTPTSHIPREVATRALLSPRISGKSRRLFTKARDQVIEVERKDPKTEQEVFCARLKKLTLSQLGNITLQISRGLRRIGNALKKTTLESLRKPLEQAETILKYRAGWVAQEIQSRTFNPERIDATGN